MVSHCNCPAADYQTLCKHGVATALAFNMQLSGLDGEEGAVAQVPDARARLRGYFERQAQPALLDVLIDEIRRDPKRWDYWLRKVELSEQPLAGQTEKHDQQGAAQAGCVGVAGGERLLQRGRSVV